MQVQASLCLPCLAQVGEPLESGPQTLAVGVRVDLPDVHRALSYWIARLRSCSPNQRQVRARAAVHLTYISTLDEPPLPLHVSCSTHASARSRAHAWGCALH